MTTPHPANSGHRVDLNPASAVARHARGAGNRTAIHYPGGDLTYAALDAKAGRLAAALTGGGALPGDRVAYLGLNSAAFLVTMLAAFRAGFVFVPVNFRLADPELAAVLRRSGATVLVCEEGHRAAADRVREQTLLARLLTVDDDPEVPATPGDAPGWEPWSAAIGAAGPTQEPVRRTADEPAVLMFTSGTTGLPKGVVLTYGNIWWNGVNVELMMDTRRGDTTLAAAPMFHIGALNSFVVRTLVRGGGVVVRRGFDPARFVDDVETHRVNSTFAVPAMLAPILRVPGGLGGRDLSSLRAVVVAGAPVPPSLVVAFAEQGVLLEQAWGLTETSPFATHLPAELTLEKAGSAGLPMPCTEVRVVDPVTGGPLGPGVPGELVVRGPNVTPGYWEDPEATAAAFDSEGWFHSGDVGHLDEDGFVYIVDRIKDMIITGGENVYPAEVERVLSAMPGITDVAVVGVPDERWGETVAAVVTVADGTALDLDSLRAWASDHLARYKLPRRLRVVREVPRNASGKLVKPQVKALMDEQEGPA